MDRLRSIVPLLVICTVWVSTGCSDAKVIELNDDVSDVGLQEDASDVGEDADVHDEDVEPQPEPMGPDEFEKPPEEQHHHDHQMPYIPNDAFSPREEAMAGSYSGFSGRPHMRFTERAVESWIYADEYLVFDGYEYRYGYPHLPADYEILAVNEGRKLPMRLVEVQEDDGFPTIDEIESWSEEQFDTSAFVEEKENEEVFHYSIIIPPWAFDEKGAYDIELLFRPVHVARPDGAFNVILPVSHRSVTAYVGSEIYTSPGEDVSSRDDDAVEVQSDIVSQALWSTKGMFLAPPAGVSDWSSAESSDELNMAKAFEVPGETVTLELYTVAMRWILMIYYNLGPKLHYVIQDGEIIDTFLFEPGGETPSDWGGEGDDGIAEKLEIDIEMPEEGTTQVKVVAVPFPYQPYSEDLVEEFGETPPLHPVQPTDSNVLILERASED